VRDGRSIAAAVFQILLRSVQPGARATQLKAAEKELDAQGELQKERDYLRQTGRNRWRRRPTDANFRYCGLDEFDGKIYACEVKNADQDCGDFVPADDPQNRFCRSCAFNRTPSDRIFQTLIQTLGKRDKGISLRDDVKKQFEAQAQSEYQECVDFAGLMNARPGLLPICEAYSTAEGADGPRFVIGPIVNTGNRCPKWRAGANTSAQQALGRLDALAARAKAALEMPPPEAPRGLGGGTLYSDRIQQQKEMQGNADGDVVEFCLLELGANPDFALSVSTMFLANVWSATRTPGGLSASGTMPDASQAPSTTQDAPVGGPATAAPGPGPGAPAWPPQQAPQSFGTQPPPGLPQGNAAFQLQPNLVYAHPANPGIRLAVTPQPPHGVAWVNLPNGATQPYDLGAFQRGVWTQLSSPFGPLPIALNVNLPYTVFAAWM
jgi:hypothetical protein